MALIPSLGVPGLYLVAGGAQLLLLGEDYALPFAALFAARAARPPGGLPDGDGLRLASP